MSWGPVLRCPMCGEPMSHRRPRALREDQPGLVPGWDCAHDHALETPPADYRRAQMERLTAEIAELLADRVDLTDPVDLTGSTDAPAPAPGASAR